MNLQIDELILFSDIHWGINGDSDLSLDKASQFISWMINIANTRKKKIAFAFLGDWFHNRNSVSVKTFYRSYEMLKELSKTAPVIMCIGNHDTFLKNVTDISSIIAFEQLKNVFIVKSNLIIESFGKKLCFASWNADFSNAKNCDALFGHFEFEGAKLCGALSKGRNPKEIIDVCPKVFSGHYHIRNTYSYKNGSITCIGSPFEQDLGDYETPKGLSILDINSMSIEFIQNNISPKHVKVKISDLIEKKVTLDKINNNIPILIADVELPYDSTMKIVAAINARNPFTKCEVEYSIKTAFENIKTDASSFIDVTSVNEYVSRYIDKMFEEEWPEIKEIDKAKLLNKAKELLEEND